MLLQTIELKNFRQFLDEKIDFSIDSERNVTLIMGENGTGKTTFAQAFFWCFYGETDFTDKNMLNRAIAEQMTPDQKETVKVAVKLIHGSAKYEISRSQEYKKSYSNKVTGANTILNISIKSEDGNTRYLKPIECELEIKKILPKELANYFFFDGERIEKMSKEIASGRKSGDFADAVIGLTGLKATLLALEHLNPNSSSSVMGKFNAAYTSDSNGLIQKLSQEIEVLQEQIEKNEKRLAEIEDEINKAYVSKLKFEQDIKQFEDGAKLQKERDRLQNDLERTRIAKSQFIKSVCRQFNSGIQNFFGMSLTKRALETLSTTDFGGKDIPEMHSKTIEFLLQRGTCICGTHLDPGTIPYNKVAELQNYLPPQSIGVTVGEFIKNSRKIYSENVTVFSDITEQMSLISQQDESISDIESQLMTISEKLGGNNMLEQVKILNKQILTCSGIIKEQTEEQKKLIFNQGQYESERKQKENSRSELSLLDKNNQKIELYKKYTQRIYDELLKEYKEKEKQVRERLQLSINEIFKSIYDGALSLTIDEKYNISVNVTDFEGGIETSSAQSISVIFAFISAIIKMARDNQRDGSDEVYSEPYPLVMDAPLSVFDKRRIKAICSAIPETAEQVIIFIKDTDGEIAENHLGKRVKVRHFFEKIDEFHTQLK